MESGNLVAHLGATRARSIRKPCHRGIRGAVPVLMAQPSIGAMSLRTVRSAGTRIVAASSRSEAAPSDAKCGNIRGTDRPAAVRAGGVRRWRCDPCASHMALSRMGSSVRAWLRPPRAAGICPPASHSGHIRRLGSRASSDKKARVGIAPVAARRGRSQQILSLPGLRISRVLRTSGA